MHDPTEPNLAKDVIMLVPLKRIDLGFIPPFYIMRLGDYINLWDQDGTPLKPVVLTRLKKKASC